MCLGVWSIKRLNLSLSSQSQGVHVNNGAQMCQKMYIYWDKTSATYYYMHRYHCSCLHKFKQRWSLNLLVKQNKYPFLSQRFLFFQYTQEWIFVTNDCQGFVCKGLWVVSTYIWKKGEQDWATPSHNNRMVVPKVRDYCLHWFSFWTSKRPTWILKAKSKWLF